MRAPYGTDRRSYTRHIAPDEGKPCQRLGKRWLALLWAPWGYREKRARNGANGHQQRRDLRIERKNISQTGAWTARNPRNNKGNQTAKEVMYFNARHRLTKQRELCVRGLYIFLNIVTSLVLTKQDWATENTLRIMIENTSCFDSCISDLKPSQRWFTSSIIRKQCISQPK